MPGAPNTLLYAGDCPSLLKCPSKTRLGGSIGTRFISGDAHANALAILHFLQANGFIDACRKIAELDVKLYDVFGKIYEKWDFHKKTTLTELSSEEISNDLKQFNEALTQTMCIPTNGTYISIGDDLADRGACDLLTLQLWAELDRKKVNFHIVASNHTDQFILAFYVALHSPSKDPAVIAERYRHWWLYLPALLKERNLITHEIEEELKKLNLTRFEPKSLLIIHPAYLTSLQTMASLIERGLTTQDDIEHLLKVYLKHYLPFESYQDGDRIVTISHAPIGFNGIISYANKYQVALPSDEKDFKGYFAAVSEIQRKYQRQLINESGEWTLDGWVQDYCLESLKVHEDMLRKPLAIRDQCPRLYTTHNRAHFEEDGYRMQCRASDLYVHGHTSSPFYGHDKLPKHTHIGLDNQVGKGTLRVPGDQYRFLVTKPPLSNSSTLIQKQLEANQKLPQKYEILNSSLSRELKNCFAKNKTLEKALIDLCKQHSGAVFNKQLEQLEKRIERKYRELMEAFTKWKTGQDALFIKSFDPLILELLGSTKKEQLYTRLSRIGKMISSILVEDLSASGKKELEGILGPLAETIAAETLLEFFTNELEAQGHALQRGRAPLFTGFFLGSQKSSEIPPAVVSQVPMMSMRSTPL